jgi:hypothetical protein
MINSGKGFARKGVMVRKQFSSERVIVMVWGPHFNCGNLFL